MNLLKVLNKDEIERDNQCAVLYQPVPDGVEKAATLVCPFEINNNWSCSPYQEDKIIPAYLQAEMTSTVDGLQQGW